MSLDVHLCSYMHVIVYCIVDPPAITTVEVTGRCTNDFTVSWTAASNEEGLYYTVSLLSLLPDGMAVDQMNKSYNFTELLPNTAYNVSVFSRLRTPLMTACLGMPNIAIVTTLTVEEGVPQSELILYIVPLKYLH